MPLVFRLERPQLAQEGAYWAGWQADDDGPEARPQEYFAHAVITRLVDGLDAVDTAIRSAEQLRLILDDQIDRHYRRLLGAIALTELLHSTSLGKDIFKAEDLTSPSATFSADGGEATWALHVSPKYVPRILTGYRPEPCSQWWHSDTLYVEARHPASVSTTFRTVFKKLCNGGEPDTEAYVSLRPYSNVQHILQRFDMPLDKTLAAPYWAHSPN